MKTYQNSKVRKPIIQKKKKMGNQCPSVRCQKSEPEQVKRMSVVGEGEPLVMAVSPGRMKMPCPLEGAT